MVFVCVFVVFCRDGGGSPPESTPSLQHGPLHLSTSVLHEL